MHGAATVNGNLLQGVFSTYEEMLEVIGNPPPDSRTGERYLVLNTNGNYDLFEVKLGEPNGILR